MSPSDSALLDKARAEGKAAETAGDHNRALSARSRALAIAKKIHVTSRTRMWRVR